MPKNLEASHKIISVTLLASGRLIMATEKRMYELTDNVWQPMVFADDPVDEATPVAPAESATPAAPWEEPKS